MKRIAPQSSLLIVFTDELGSTIKDEQELAGIRGQPNQIRAYKKNIVARRTDHFGKLVRQLLPTGSQIVKNIGDALVITLRTHNGDKALLLCIKALFQAWQSLKPSVRVAVHLTPITQVATGTDLDEFLTQVHRHIPSIKTKKRLVKLWPSIALIEHDVFGAPMNRTGRLAGIPKGAQFVISQQVAIGVAGDKGKDDIERLEIGLVKLRDNLEAHADVIPIARVRNINTITFEQPWSVIELRLRKEPPNLIQQFKSVQAIRIVEAYSTERLKEDAIAKASNKLLMSLIQSKCAKFHIDLFFNIIDGCLIYDIKRDRKQDDIPPEPRPIDADMVKRCAMHVVFCSCPDLATDECLRDARLAMSSDDVKWQPQTLRIHHVARYLCAQPDTALPSVDSYYFLEFQFRRGRPDDPGLFQGIKRTYMNGELHTIAYGLLEGETDGFVLLRSTTKGWDDVRKFILEAARPEINGNPAEFIERIATITLFRLSLKHRNQDAQVWTALSSYADKVDYELPKPI